MYSDHRCNRDKSQSNRPIFVYIVQLDLLEAIYNNESATRLVSAYSEDFDDTMAVLSLHWRLLAFS